MSWKKVALVCLGVGASIWMAGCGGSAPSVGVSVTAVASTVDGGDTTTLSATVSNDQNSAGVTWTVTGGGTLSSTTTTGATYTAPAPSANALSATVTATSVADKTKSASATIAVPAQPAISTTTLAANVGAAFSSTLAATGGIAPYTWSLTQGTLPTGWAVSTAGVVSGPAPVAAEAGAVNLTFAITDSGTATALTATQQVVLTISPAPAITFTGTVAASATYNVAFTGSAAATGGASTLTYSVLSGSLPGGLTLNTATGAITGMPNAAGTFLFSIQAADAYGDSASKAYSVVVSYPALTITTAATLPTGYVGSNYSQTLAATGGSGTGYTWALKAGSSLPPGLTLSSTGAITGKPTASGASSFTITLTDSASNTTSTAFSLTINPALGITNGTTLPNAYVGSNYSLNMAATGGSGTGYKWTVSTGSTLPGGLTLSTAGALSGAPTTAGTPSFSVTVSDSASNSATATFSITILPGVSITPVTLPAGYPGTAYPTTTLAATGGSATGYKWTWAAPSGSTLPAGLSLSTAGVITGSPTNSTTANVVSSVVVTVTDSAGNTGSATFQVTIEATVAISTTVTLPTGVVNTPYSQTLAATGGSGGYGWTTNLAGTTSLAALNLTLSPAGLVSGTPATIGTATFAATVSDSTGHTATVTFSVTVTNALTITTTSLPPAYTNTLYSQTLAVAGGSGTGYTWSTTGTSNLATFNLTLSSAGVLSGTPTTTGTASFTAQVKDSASHTATQAFTVTVYGALTLPTPNPSSLGAGTTGQAYSGSIIGSGGSGNYCYAVTGLPSDGLSSPAPNSPCGYIASSVPITGTPTSAQTVSFSVKLTDTTTNVSVTQTGYNIVVSNPAALTLPAPNPSSLPSATVNQTYSGQINSAGGVGPTYTWTVNSVVIPTNGTAVAESNGISVSSAGGPTLFVSGTPTSTSSVPLSVSVTDSASHTAGPNTYTIAVNSAGSQVSGQIFLTTGCGGGGNVPAITVSINTNPVQTTTTDINGNYSFGTVPNGTYTITPSITGPSSAFYPATQSVTVSNNSASAQIIGASLGYTVSGTVGYTGTQTGQVYLNLNNNCGGSAEGTSIAYPFTNGGAFTIRGVPPGTYTLDANMDNLGQGQPNATDPTNAGTQPTPQVSNANVTGVAVTLADPTVTAPTSAPPLSAITPNEQGVVINFGAIKSNGVEAVTSYTVEWSTSSTFAGTPSSWTFKAVGTHSNVWILNNSVVGSGTFVGGTTYYFRAKGVNSAGQSGYAVYGGGTPTGVTILTSAVPSGYNTVTGAVSIPAGITPTGPLYVGFYNQNNNDVYATIIPLGSISTSSPNSYTVYVPTDSSPDYINFVILDQNNDGLIDLGDVSNTDNNGGSSGIAITPTGTLTGYDPVLPTANSTLAVTTQYQQDTSYNGSQPSTQVDYSLNFNLRKGNKLPVSVTLTSGPNVIHPVDLSACNSCGTEQFQYSVYLNSVMPVVGQAYDFLVTYSDSPTDTQTVIGTVTGWNGTSTLVGASDLATNLQPSESGSTSLTPTFTWAYPANAGDFTYSFYMNGPTGTIWQIPSTNSNFNGFTSAQVPMPAGITWGTDPIESGNPPSVGSLTSGDNYQWQIQVNDSNGNQALTTVYYIP
jgi:hypothetical protein